MRSIYLLTACCLIAGAVPFFNPTPSASSLVNTMPEWPEEYLNDVHKTTPLTQKETQFYTRFPGDIIKFTGGRTDYVIKRVTKPTRKLHPASDCYRGSGYTVTAEPVFIDETGRRWGQFTAVKESTTIVVKERIYNDQGQHWTDVSEWFWTALMNKTTGPWWVVTTAESLKD